MIYIYIKKRGAWPLLLKREKKKRGGCALDPREEKKKEKEKRVSHFLHRKTLIYEDPKVQSSIRLRKHDPSTRIYVFADRFEEKH
jgi:hypothetical protein